MYAVDKILSKYPTLSAGAVAARLRYATFVSLTGRYLYFEVPKAACSTMKWFLHDLEKLPPPRLLLPGFRETHRDMAIHNRENIALPSLVELDDATQRMVLEDPGFLRVTVVRHPYDRIVSAWRSKVFLQEPGYEAVYDALARSPGGKREAEPISFPEFVDYVARHEDPALCDPHWRLQVAHMFSEAIDYTLIGRVEAMSEVAEAFRRHLGRSDVPSFRRANAMPSLAEMEPEETEEIVATIGSLYGADFERLGYAPPAARPSPRAERPAASGDAARLLAEIRERNILLAMLYHERNTLHEERRKRDQVSTDEYREQDRLRQELDRERSRSEALVRRLTAERDSVLASRSWRLTRPLRDLGSAMRRVRRLLS